MLNKNIKNVSSIIQPFYESLQRFPHNNALWVNKAIYSYAELYQLATPLAQLIEQFKDERVLVYSQRSISAYRAIVASLLVGKAYVPLNPNMPNERNEMMALLADSRLIVADGALDETLFNFLSKLKDKKYRVILLSTHEKPKNTKNLEFYTESDIQALDCFRPTYEKDTNADACLLFTSGSTGTPKGVMLSHENILSYVDHTIERYQLTEKDRVSQMTELTFDFSVQDMFMSWAVGACVYAFPEKGRLSSESINHLNIKKSNTLVYNKYHFDIDSNRIKLKSKPTHVFIVSNNSERKIKSLKYTSALDLIKSVNRYLLEFPEYSFYSMIDSFEFMKSEEPATKLFSNNVNFYKISVPLNWTIEKTCIDIINEINT